jgi:hypothetical protein
MRKIRSRDGDHILIPTPPKKANAFKLIVKGTKRTRIARVAINDIDTLLGVSGELRFIEKKGVKVVREYDPPYTWTGSDILELRDRHEGKKRKE